MRQISDEAVGAEFVDDTGFPKDCLLFEYTGDP